MMKDLEQLWAWYAENWIHYSFWLFCLMLIVFTVCFSMPIRIWETYLDYKKRARLLEFHKYQQEIEKGKNHVRDSGGNSDGIVDAGPASIDSGGPQQ